MPPKPRKKAAPKVAPKEKPGPPPKVFLEVDDRRLPFVHYQDWTIDDLMNVEAVLPGTMTAADAYDKVAGSTHSAGLTPHLFALMWWVAERHAGERTSWLKVKLDIDSADRLNVDVVPVEAAEAEDPNSPEG
jgi:hypothetical protein